MGVRRKAKTAPTTNRPGETASLGERCLRCARRNGFVLVGLACLTLVAGLLLNLDRLMDEMVESAAIREARNHATSVNAFRRLYATEVVARAQGHGADDSPDHSHERGTNLQPLTRSMRLAYEASGSALTRIYNDGESRLSLGHGPQDDFEAKALLHLRETPEVPFVRFETVAGARALRYAVVDGIHAASVVAQDEPEGDSQARSALGVIAVRVSMDRIALQTRAEFTQIVGMVLLVTILGIGVGLVLVSRLHEQHRLVEQRVTDRTAELVLARDQGAQDALELAEGRARLDTILRTAPCGIVTIDREGIIHSFNRSAERTFQYASDEVVGHNVSVLMPQPYREEHDGYLANYARTGERKVIGHDREVVGRRKDGTAFPLRLSVAAVEGSDLFTGHVEDRTDINARTAAIEAAADMIVITDADGRVEYVNQAFVDGTGYELEDIVGRSTAALKSGQQDEAFYEDLWNTICRGDVWSGELINRRKDGTTYAEDMTIAPVRDAAGVVTQFVAIKRDITQRKQAEEELAKARDDAQAAGRAKSEFLANMSHEIRTPMNAVIGMTGLLLTTDLTAEQHECADIVRTAGEALLDVVNNILDFSKIEAGKFELEVLDFGLTDVIEDVAGLMGEAAAAKGLELTCSIDPALRRGLRGDASRLRQILTNLVGNAVKFTSEGEVCIRATPVEDAGKRLLVRFEVRDTGIGVPADVQADIFDAFSQADGSTTRRFGGTGLGLVISRRLSELMHGEIGVQSDGRNGSTFWFTARLEHSAQPAIIDRQRSGNLCGLRILIVDDNKTNRTILRAQVQGWGAQSAEASGGSESLGMLKAAVVAGDAFDVLLLDMQMPGLDGLQVARAIRADPALDSLRILLLTSIGQHELWQQAREAGVAVCMTKPIRQSILFEGLVGVTRGPADESPAAQTPLMPATIGRILVVEDNPVNQKVAVRMLEKLGHLVDVVANGEEALAVLRTMPYDLALMDCSMPVMDGYEATRALRQREAEEGAEHLPVIALTANAFREDGDRCREAGMDDYITKPITQERLGRAVARWLDGSS